MVCFEDLKREGEKPEIREVNLARQEEERQRRKAEETRKKEKELQAERAEIESERWGTPEKVYRTWESRAKSLVEIAKEYVRYGAVPEGYLLIAGRERMKLGDKIR
ncbi:MAG: hypothetical protein A3G93_15735 [Nitrospinae bacterium RIFCSPLOWO2_12_FULL_45_22]|nr:MAG: hypothetical protein A3G93_15735 [Nitrospinae bacterium RIFCSPLOWO2_12_FULL_45_22]